MAAKGPRTLQTLPSEGLVLEQVIDDMREEYGYPATPQEYRLIVRVAPEEPERVAGGRHRAGPGAASGNGSGRARVAPDPAAEERGAPPGARVLRQQPAGELVDDDEDGPVPARRARMRRRRRGRGRPGASAGGDAAGSSEDRQGPGGGSPEGGSGGEGDASPAQD